MHLRPQDNPKNCPCCGYCPCSIDCRLGLQQWDLEDWEDELAAGGPPQRKPEPLCPPDLADFYIVAEGLERIRQLRGGGDDAQAA